MPSHPRGSAEEVHPIISSPAMPTAPPPNSLGGLANPRLKVKRVTVRECQSLSRHAQAHTSMIPCHPLTVRSYFSLATLPPSNSPPPGYTRYCFQPTYLEGGRRSCREKLGLPPSPQKAVQGRQNRVKLRNFDLCIAIAEDALSSFISRTDLRAERRQAGRDGSWPAYCERVYPAGQPSSSPPGQRKNQLVVPSRPAKRSLFPPTPRGILSGQPSKRA